MRNFAKMALMSGSPDRGRTDTSGGQMNGGYMNFGNMGYDMENRFRDRRGREHYDNGRYAPRNESSGTLTWDNSRGAESAYRGDYGRSEMNEPESRRRRDSRGRFRSEMDGDTTEAFYPYVPPIYEEYGGMNQIGFASHDGSERNNLHMIRGGISEKSGKLDEKTIEKWMRGLQNEDGTIGPHWSKEQTTQVMKQKNVDCDPLEFFVAMNLMYSDFYGAAKKANANNVDFYVNMAKAFLDDKDAGTDDKLTAYYHYIVK